jgi:general secretion pathway protein G
MDRNVLASAARRRRRFRGQAGFTLVEILVVITIIGLIMALVGPRVLGYLGESKAKAAKIQIESFASALDLYYLDLGHYPNSNEGLPALTHSNNLPGWNGPYLRGGVVPNDPWGHSYIYRSPALRNNIAGLGRSGGRQWDGSRYCQWFQRCGQWHALSPMPPSGVSR